MNGNRSNAVIAMMAGIVVAFALGHLVATISPVARESNDGFQMRTGSRPDGFSGGETGGQSTQGRSWQQEKTRVVARWEASPSVVVDFDLLDETRRLLEKTPVADLELWMRELRPLGDTDWDKDIPALLREMIMKVLVERCGGGFVRSLAADPEAYRDFDLDELVEHWLKQDPKAVLEWLDRGNLPEQIADDLDDYREDSILELSGKDPEEFERRLAAVDADTRESILEDYSFRMGSPEKREGLLERATRSPHGEAMALYDGLLRREGANDPKMAVATLQELPVSGDDRATLDDWLVSSLMSDLRINGHVEDKSPVLQSWIERNSERKVPSVILEAFNDWSLIDSDRAVAWLAKLDSGFQHDDLAKRLVDERTRSEDADLTELLGITARIGDFNIRAEANRRIKKAWKPDDAAMVAKWVEGLPPEDRERLNRDLRDE